MIHEAHHSGPKGKTSMGHYYCGPSDVDKQNRNESAVLGPNGQNLNESQLLGPKGVESEWVNSTWAQ